MTPALLDAAGKTQPLLAKPGIYGHPRLSPDGQRLALEVTGGAGKPQPLVQSKYAQTPWSFSPDGKWWAVRGAGFEKPHQPIVDCADRERRTGLRAGTPEVFAPAPFTQGSPAFSPDGRWLAYTSVESGTQQVYVRAFPGKGGKWQVSNNGGLYPMWSRSDLFFETSDRHLMAAGYTVKADSFVAGKPRLVSEKPIGGSFYTKSVDLAPDGKRVVALMPASEVKRRMNERP